MVMKPKSPLTPAADLLRDRMDELGQVTDEPGRLTRTFLSPAMERANALVGGWMREAGLTVREDETGNLIGRREADGVQASTPEHRAKAGRTVGAKTLLIGSHLDTVRNAGRFDGALGVVLPIIALGELRRLKISLPFHVEVLGFSEEEAVRFLGAYIGSKAFTGRLSATDLALKDARGLSLREVIESHSGRTFVLPKSAHRTENLLGYVEVHIEQGPVLEADGLPLGVVSAIASQTRGRLTFRGKAGHAGTTPMNLRRDSLTGAAEFILFAEAFATGRSPLVATVGTISVPAGAANVIPGETIVSLDVRHPSNAKCRQAVNRLTKAALAIARRRGLVCEWEQTMEHRATACSKELTQVLREGIATVQPEAPTLVSGAGHDGVIMAELTPIAMMFVRCRDGLSHHPGEFVSPGDLQSALLALIAFLRCMPEQQSP